MTSLTLHRARVVLPVSSPPIRDGAVAVLDGRILAVGRYDDLAEQFRDRTVETVEWAGVLAPGLVNAHTHLQYTDMADVGADSYTGFEHWSHAFQIGYEREHDWAASAAEGARLALESGTTSVADVVTDISAAGALHDTGLRGIAFWEVFAWSTTGWNAGGRREALELLARIPEQPGAGLSPHALYSVDTDVLADLASIAADRGIRQHIHAAEAASENEYAATGTGVLADRWRDFGHGDLALLHSGGSGYGVIEYLDSVGSLGSTTHLAHGIYVDADDRALLRERGVAVALCPRSNEVIGLDEAPVAAYLVEGNIVSVGTDSLGSSPSLDLLDDVAALHLIARSQGYRGDDLHGRLLEAATLGGARALGLDAGDQRVGTLDAGALADFAIFDIDTDAPADALAQLVEAGAGTAVATVINGSVLWERAGVTADREARRG